MKLKSIQELRGIAALLVVAFHAKSVLLAPNDLEFLKYGDVGVDLFFVISGFIMVVATNGAPSPAAFLKRRAIRIVPLYWLITLAYVAVDVVAPQLLRSGSHDPNHVLASLFFIPTFHPRYSDQIWPVVVQGWSLNFEFFFYFLFAAALWLTPKHRGLITSAVLLIIVTAGHIFRPTEPVLITYTSPLLIEFVLGMLLGTIFLRRDNSASVAVVAALLVSTSVAALLAISNFAVGRALLFSLASASLLSIAVTLERAGIGFSNRIMLAIGDASYSLYLTHFIAVAALRWVFGLLQAPSSTGVAIAQLAVALGLSALLGWLCYILIEQPLLRRLGSVGGILRADSHTRRVFVRRAANPSIKLDQSASRPVETRKSNHSSDVPPDKSCLSSRVDSQSARSSIPRPVGPRE